jgi:beta-lactamase class A
MQRIGAAEILEQNIGCAVVAVDQHPPHQTARRLAVDRIIERPATVVDLLKRIYRAELIRPQSRNYLMDLMAQCQTGKNRMKALLPFGTQVEHKTGTLNGLSDDVGFITMPDGHRIAVAIFARGGANRPRTIAEAARTIYDGFKAAVTWPFRPALTAK